MLQIDGSFGEGGGQVLRSSLALSIITGTPFELFNIRAGRKRPGLGKQHLTSLNAAVAISNAEVTGNNLGSKRITFVPNTAQSGDYTFAVGSAGSAMLVLQTVLPALLTLNEPTTLTLQGGTHNPWAPPAEFLQRSFLKLLEKMGPKVSLQLNRYGFFPRGGGEVVVHIESAPMKPLHISEAGEVKRIYAEIISLRKQPSLLEKQKREILKQFPDIEVIQAPSKPVGPGNAVVITIEREQVTDVFTGLEKRGIPGEITARGTARRAKATVATNYAADEHLTDQLMLPMLLAEGGSFTCPKPSLHATTNAEIIKLFTGKVISFTEHNKEWLCTYEG